MSRLVPLCRNTHYLKKISALKAKLDNANNIIQESEEKSERRQEKHDQLVLQLGQWQGRAKTLEEQNQKFLEVRQEKKQSTGFFKHVLDFWK